MRILNIALLLITAACNSLLAAPPTSQQTATAVDVSLWGAAPETAIKLADDSTYLRRIMFDVVGRPATPGELTAFGLDPAEDRRAAKVHELLASDAYGVNWSHYWRDVIFLRATNIRAGIVRPAFD